MNDDKAETGARRRFLRLAAATLAAPAALAAIADAAQAQELPHQDEADPTASALGYKHDTTKVDKAKYPKHEATQKCSNCQLFQGKATDAWGPCALFGAKQVAGNGWCSAWVKKPA